MITVERKLFRNSHTMSAASSVPSIRWFFSAATIAPMKILSLCTMCSSRPGGSCGRTSLSMRSSTRSMISTVLVFGTLTMPMPTAGLPFRRASCRLSVRPSSISAMSRSRTGAPSLYPTIIAARSSSLWNSRSIFTRCSVERPTRKPPASWMCSRPKASVMSWAAMP